MILRDYPDRDALVMGLADALAADLRMALAAGPATLALPGGTTPGPVMDLLSAVRLDWDRVTVLPGDERWVGPDHPRSNAGLIRRHLLTGAGAAARFCPLWRAGQSPEAALPALTAAVAPHLPVTVLLLGMGADMHTASLFPGAEGLGAALAPDAPPLAVIRAAAAGEPRVTLTAPAIRAALHVHLMITGPEKRAALDRALSLSPADAPVAIALPGAVVHWAP